MSHIYTCASKQAKQAKQASTAQKSFFLRTKTAGQHSPGRPAWKKVVFYEKRKTPLRGDAVHRTACFYQVLIDIWSIVPVASLFIYILNISLEIVVKSAET